MMMTHEDRQQCLQLFRGGRLVFLFSKREKCRLKMSFSNDQLDRRHGGGVTQATFLQE